GVHAGHGPALEDALQAVAAPGGAQAGQVGHRGARDGALVGRVRADHGGGGGETAVGVAEDGDPVLVGDALRDQPGGAVVLVVLHLLAPLAVAGDPEVAAQAGRTAVLRAQHGVAAGGQEGHPAGAVPGAVVAGPGAAVGVDDGRQRRIALLPAGREVEDGGDGAAVAGPVGHPALLADPAAVDVGALLAQGHDLLAVDQQVVGRRLAVADRAEQDAGAVVVVAADGDVLALEGLLQAVVDGLHLRVHEDLLAVQPVHGEAEHAVEVAGGAAEDQAADREFRVGRQRLRVEAAGRRVVHAGLDLVAELVGQDVQLAARLVDADHVDRVALAHALGQLGMDVIGPGGRVEDRDPLLVLVGAGRHELDLGDGLAGARVEQAGAGA